MHFAGRLDRSIYVGLPSASTRLAILQMRTKRMTLADDVDLAKIAERTEGYSGAEIVAVCRQAGMRLEIFNETSEKCQLIVQFIR